MCYKQARFKNSILKYHSKSVVQKGIDDISITVGKNEVSVCALLYTVNMHYMYILCVYYILNTLYKYIVCIYCVCTILYMYNKISTCVYFLYMYLLIRY